MPDFYADLVEKMTKRSIRPYKESSVRTLWSQLKNLNGGALPENLDFLTDHATVMNRLEKYAVSTQRSILFALRNVVATYGRDDLMELYKEKITATEQGEGALKKGEVAPSQRGHEKSWDEIMEYQKKRVENYDGNLLGAVASLYTLFPPRRNLDYSEMKLGIKYDAKTDKEFNWLIYQEDGSAVFIFNRYKTDGVYHTQTFEVPDELDGILREYITKNGIKDGDWLLTKKSGAKFKVEDITDALHAVFGGKISTQMLRHAFVNKYNEPKYASVIAEMFGDADKMAHSVVTQQVVYKKA